MYELSVESEDGKQGYLWHVIAITFR